MKSKKTQTNTRRFVAIKVISTHPGGERRERFLFFRKEKETGGWGKVVGMVVVCWGGGKRRKQRKDQTGLPFGVCDA